MDAFINGSLKIEDLIIRPVEEDDNVQVARLIRNTLKEFGLDKPGTVYFDKETDNIYQLFKNQTGCLYYVVEKTNKIIGGGGIFPSAGLPPDTCELVKMYLLPQARGMGLGKMLIQKCIDFASGWGYQNIYLETMPELRKALKVYEQFGFVYLNHPLGNTGHYGCELWMLRKNKN
ncbi:MAG: GNAT family N-acetyltransferase [Flavisolibacter sp.]